MKQVLFSTTKAFFTLGLCLSLLSSASAQTSPQPRTDAASAIRYTGVKDDLLCFDVNVPALPGRSGLRIYDEEGRLLYEEVVKPGNLNRRYKVPFDLGKKLRFELSGRDVWVEQTFDISRQVEERLVVTASL